MRLSSVSCVAAGLFCCHNVTECLLQTESGLFALDFIDVLIIYVLLNSRFWKKKCTFILECIFPSF